MEKRVLPVANQFARFVVVGAIATLVQFGILVALVEILHAAKPTANVIGYVCGAVLNYWLNRRFAFSESKATFGRGMAKFALVSLFGFGLNTLVFVTGIQSGLHYLSAWVIAVGASLIWNYAGARWFVFR